MNWLLREQSLGGKKKKLYDKTEHQNLHGSQYFQCMHRITIHPTTPLFTFHCLVQICITRIILLQLLFSLSSLGGHKLLNPKTALTEEHH